MKQRLIAKKTKVKRYEQIISQFRQNQLFQVNQKQVYKDLNREKQGDRIIANSEDSITFWSDIWSIRKEQNQHADWLKSCRKQFENLNSMEKVETSQKMVKMQCRKSLGKMVYKDIGWKTYIVAPTSSSAAKWNPWLRKTLTILDDL